MSFTKFLLFLGLVLLLVFAFDLSVRRLQRFPAEPVWEVEGGDPDLGREGIIRHGCGACHVIPGVRLAVGRVGPKLEDFGEQSYIAGVLPNRPDNLVAWILDPPAVNPRTAMPRLGVSEIEARHIAAYLYQVQRRDGYRRPITLE